MDPFPGAASAVVLTQFFKRENGEDLKLQQRPEAIAISPEEEEREDGDDAGHSETARIKKDMIE